MSAGKNYYDAAPPSYSEIDEKKPLLPKEPEETVKRVLGMRRSSFLLSLYLVFYGVFLATGGLVFTVLEAPEEELLKRSVFRARIQFLEEHSCVQGEALDELLEVVISASNKGVSAVRNLTGESNWSFGQAVFFSSTVLTTIGYGNVTPLSRAGKLFCMVFGVFGIPLTMMLLTALVDRLLVPTTRFLYCLNDSLGHLCRAFYIRFLHLCTMYTFLIAFVWLLPAYMFSYLEPDWDFFDGAYYCFITLTTIGLGDYVPGDSPGQENRSMVKLLTTVYLYAGLIFLILCLTVFYEIPELNFGMFFLLQTDEESLVPEKDRFKMGEVKCEKYTRDTKILQESEVKVKARIEDSPSPEAGILSTIP